MTVTVARPDVAGFAPFGVFIDRPAETGTRRAYSEWLVPVSGLTLQFHTNRLPPTTLPMTVDRVERHPHAAQVFLPLSASRYVVTVLPSLGNGQPDVTRAQAFVLPATLGVVYRPGVWHAGITALDAEASFAVLMWRGTADDDVFAAVAPLAVLPPATAGKASS